MNFLTSCFAGISAAFATQLAFRSTMQEDGRLLKVRLDSLAEKLGASGTTFSSQSSQQRSVGNTKSTTSTEDFFDALRDQCNQYKSTWNTKLIELVDRVLLEK